MRRNKVPIYLMTIILPFFITSLAFGSAAVQYDYDELNRLTTASYEDGTVIEYSYDEAGNRLTEIMTTAPVTVPGAPTGVSATPGNAQATVSFTPPASDGGGAITGYAVTSSPDGITNTGPSSPITVTGLTNGTAYTFTVSATNAGGTGPASSPSNSVTPLGPPGAPTGASATAGNAQATVTFMPPASDGGGAITGYTVTSSPGGITNTGASSPITVTGLTNGTAYTFTVSATNAGGTGPASYPSNSVTPLGPPDAPGAPTGVSATEGNAQATVTFMPPASDGGAAITG
jgi:YD repeat-containing protein